MAVSCPKCAANFSKKPVNVLDSPEFSIFLGFIARLVAQGMSPEDSVRAAIAAGFSLAHAAARTEGTLTASKLRRLRRRASTRAAAVSAVAAIVASAARGGEAAAESARAQQERAAEQAALEQAQQARAAEQAAREAAAEAARAQQERAAEQAARESAQAQQERAAEQVARDAAHKERVVREAMLATIHAKQHGLVFVGKELWRITEPVVASYVRSLEPRAESSSATSTRSLTEKDRPGAPVSAVGASSRRTPANKLRR